MPLHVLGSAERTAVTENHECLRCLYLSFEEFSQTNAHQHTKERHIKYYKYEKRLSAFLSVNLITASGLILMQIKGAGRVELRMHEGGY